LSSAIKSSYLMVQNHSSSQVRECANRHVRRPSLPSSTYGRSMLCWQ